MNLQHQMRWLILIHALSGVLALAVFLIPFLSKKGSKLHIKAGWVYAYAMIAVGLSAFIITPWRAFFDPTRTPSSMGFATFLFFISSFTLSALSYGISVLKFKKRREPSRTYLHLAPPILLIILGIATQIVGLLLQNVLLIAFPFIAHFSAKTQLSYWLSSPRTKMHWWYEHMNGMGTACIATLTAFLVTAVPRIWPGPVSESPLLWIAPGVILGTVLNRWAASYRSEFGDLPASGSPRAEEK